MQQEKSNRTGWDLCRSDSTPTPGDKVDPRLHIFRPNNNRQQPYAIRRASIVSLHPLHSSMTVNTSMQVVRTRGALM